MKTIKEIALKLNHFVMLFFTLMFTHGITAFADEVDDNSTSVLGGVFGVVGEVIALPFRLVGGLIDFIF